MNKIPQHVMHFYGNADYALECIALKQITLLHVEKLNDPFDPVPDCTIDYKNDYAALLTDVRKRHPLQFESFKEKLPQQIWNKTVTDLSKTASEIRAGMFVFSTCAVRERNHPKNNLYMWGHYGNGHRGVAIEFNTTAFVESVKEQDDSNTEPIWWKMEYPKEIPKINCEDIFELVMSRPPNADNLRYSAPRINEKFRKIYSFKGKVWKSENEYRLVFISIKDGTGLKILRDDISNSAITAVYLGCRAAEQEQLRNDFIYETQRNFPNANVFLAKKKPGEYTLDFDQIV